MILYRAIAALPRRLPLHRRLAAAVLAAPPPPPLPSSTPAEPKRSYNRTPTSPKLNASEVPPRPSEIPYQVKIANSVRLQGRIAVPIKLENLPDGDCAAVSVLVQDKANDSPQLSIPIIFRGETARIAVFYIKENDTIFVTGSMFGDVQTSRDQDAQATIKVLVESVNFVKQKEDIFKDGHATNGNDILTRMPSGCVRNPENVGKDFWTDLIVNTQDWLDNRLYKETKMNPRYPDFTHKVNRKALWLDSAPRWVLPKLDGLVFNSQNIESFPKGSPDDSSDKAVQGKYASNKENLWWSLVNNPSEWFDNRADKLKPNHPDFKHKKTGEGLWLGSSMPAWVLPKLREQETKQNGVAEKDNQYSHYHLLNATHM